MSLDGKSLPERPLYPSPTSGDGKVRPNSARSGKGQGKGAATRFVTCRNCGFTVDSKTTDKSGGTQDGNGGYSEVTKTAGDGVTDLVSDSYVDGGTTTRYPGTGEQTVKKGAGCPLCGSKNFM